MISFSAMIPNMFVFEPVSGSITGVQLPGFGDWEITSPTVVTDETITFHGNIIVTNSLTLINTTLIIDCDYDGQFGIDVLSGGSVAIEDNEGFASNITSANQYAYTFRIRYGAQAELVNSEIHKCGFNTDPIGDSSGFYIESSDVMIQGCSISNNYIGLLFNSTNSIDGYISSDNISNVNYVTYNMYGLYAMDSTTVECSNMVVTENEINDVYAASIANVQMSNCYSVSVGGPGQVLLFDNPGCWDHNDYFEINYNASANTLRYDGWHCWQNGNEKKYYANSYCVLRRNHDYIFEENWKLGIYALGSASGPGNAGAICGWSYSISYPSAPSDNTNLFKNQGGVKSISIPSNYPILYCTITFSLNYNILGYIDGNSMQSIDMYVIFGIPIASGNDPYTGIGNEGIHEYLYENDDGKATNLPDNIDLAGPYWRDSGSMTLSSYYYGGGSNTSGINFNKKVVVQLACAAAYNCIYGFDAAGKIQTFVNYLVFGTWSTITDAARTRSVNTSLQFVTTTMASNPANNIIHDYPADPAHNNDALGVHGSDTNPNGINPPNNWDYQCDDFAAISTALDRSIGLASRQVTGWDIHYNGSHRLNYHVWTEVWIPDGQDSQGTDDQWCVFDACGLEYYSGQIKDNDTNLIAGTNRTDYIDDFNSIMGKPYHVYCYFDRDDPVTVQYDLKTYYGIS
jgi:hypothetical protein